MTKEREALKLGIESLEWHNQHMHRKISEQAITAMKKALAQPEPDWKGLVLAHNEECESRCDKDRCGYARYFKNNGRRCPTCPVYEKIDIDITPPQRTWVGLTDDEKSELWEISRAALPRYPTFAGLIEAKLKERNT